jgi:hypothetical protein
VATNGCDTIGVLVTSCKAVQKAVKKTESIVPAIAKVLEIHTASEPVVKSAFDCIEECTTSTAAGNTTFLKALASAELDGVYLYGHTQTQSVQSDKLEISDAYELHVCIVMQQGRQDPQGAQGPEQGAT